ncbi:uncharacterized protein LOC132304485 [Cornus florida]|uniref:uncharacterized protein LOC132304485 n=1 Tax=Cornus florida TaxID=4283 RepID=UPI00289F7F4B|nr:uncharacterized protein LOC132304485 [Cornus florida]
MQIIKHNDDFVPRVSFERHRSSYVCPLSPLLLIDGLSRKSLSYNKLPQKPLKLTVLKLDDSSFDIEVAKTATIAELKLAVEAVFNHMPKKGPGKISWPHVWGHFCLCYDGQKLLTDRDCIIIYGIKDGDQLQFIRHVSINYNFIKSRSSDQESDSEQPGMPDSCEEREHNGEKKDGCDDQENLDHLQYDNQVEDGVRPNAFNCSLLLGGWFSYHSLASSRRRFGARCLPSRFTDGFLGSFKKISRHCCKKLLYRRESRKEV